MCYNYRRSQAATAGGRIMAQAPEKIRKVDTEKPERSKPSAQESLQRMEEFEKRKEKFVATARKGKD
jgi:hypothetical protein